MSVTSLSDWRERHHHMPVLLDENAAFFEPLEVSLETTKRIGDFAMDRTFLTESITYGEDLYEAEEPGAVRAMGLTGIKLCMKGVLTGRAGGQVDLELPNANPVDGAVIDPGDVTNVLLMSHRAVMGIHLAFDTEARKPTYSPVNGVNPVAALMRAIHRKPLGRKGIMYDSIVAYDDNPGRGIRDVTVVTGYDSTIKLQIPLDRIPHAEVAGQSVTPCNRRLHLVR